MLRPERTATQPPRLMEFYLAEPIRRREWIHNRKESSVFMEEGAVQNAVFFFLPAGGTEIEAAKVVAVKRIRCVFLWPLCFKTYRRTHISEHALVEAPPAPSRQHSPEKFRLPIYSVSRFARVRFPTLSPLPAP